MREGVELLKHAIGECANLGDAWYYRSLLERKLGNARLAEYSLDKAQKNDSEAWKLRLDPFTLATSPAAKPAGPIREKWAVVVGIGKFADAVIHPLKFTNKDATDFADSLKNPNIGRFKPANVALLTDGQATTRNIKEKLNWLARNAGPDDLVVIYIATHGSARELDTAGVNYIITADTELGPKFDQDSLFATALPMVDIATTVANRVRAQRVAIFVDTCYGGAAASGGGAKLIAPGIASASVSKDTMARMSQGTGRVILAASTGDQESLESPALQHGLFTYYLLQALQRSHGMDPMVKIFDYVRQEVSTKAKQQQTPVMSQSEEGGEIVIGAAPGSSGLMAGRY